MFERRFGSDLITHLQLIHGYGALKFPDVFHSIQIQQEEWG